MGADVTHPSPGTEMKSIAAVVCSTDLEGLRVCGEWRCQESKVEIIDHFEEICEKLLRKFYMKNKIAPKRIIFYRDGVSISQREIVQNEEIPCLLRAISKVFGKEDVKLTFLIVRKRHHYLFFSNDKQYTDKNGNLKSGTVIDSEVCNGFGFDWYCYSHGGLKGTSRPALYDVLYDDNKWDVNDLILTTYWQCFTFMRSTKAISIVPMAYYAHLLAFRARYLTKGTDRENTEITDESVTVNPIMIDKMYYI